MLSDAFFPGKQLQIRTVKKAELAKGEWNAPWIPPFAHPSMPADSLTPEMVRMIMSSFHLAASNGSVDVSGDWNRLLPDYEFTGVEAFLKMWSSSSERA